MLMAFIYQLYLKCFAKGEDDMDASGFITLMGFVSATLKNPPFQSLVTDGSISQGELDGTRSDLAAVYATLNKTPRDKIEAMVAQFNEQIMGHLDKVVDGWGSDTLGAFQQAQILAGYVTTIMAKSGLRE
jgi:hypothetical protein